MKTGTHSEYTTTPVNVRDRHNELRPQRGFGSKSLPHTRKALVEHHQKQERTSDHGIFPTPETGRMTDPIDIEVTSAWSGGDNNRNSGNAEPSEATAKQPRSDTQEGRNPAPLSAEDIHWSTRRSSARSAIQLRLATRRSLGQPTPSWCGRYRNQSASHPPVNSTACWREPLHHP